MATSGIITVKPIRDLKSKNHSANLAEGELTKVYLAEIFLESCSIRVRQPFQLVCPKKHLFNSLQLSPGCSWGLRIGELVKWRAYKVAYFSFEQDAYGRLRGMSWCMFSTKCRWKRILTSRLS